MNTVILVLTMGFSGFSQVLNTDPNLQPSPDSRPVKKLVGPQAGTNPRVGEIFAEQQKNQERPGIQKPGGKNEITEGSDCDKFSDPLANPYRAKSKTRVCKAGDAMYRQQRGNNQRTDSVGYKIDQVSSENIEVYGAVMRSKLSGTESKVMPGVIVDVNMGKAPPPAAAKPNPQLEANQRNIWIADCAKGNLPAEKCEGAPYKPQQQQSSTPVRSAGSN